MATPEPSVLHTNGKVAGKTANFFYHKGASEDETKLSWTEGHKVHPDANWTHIPARNIIAVVPLENGTTETLNLLYVEDNHLKHVELSNPPGELVQDFQCSSPIFVASGEDHAIHDLNFHVIVSVGSGTGKAKATWEQLVKPFLDFFQLQQDRDYTPHTTDSETSISDLTEKTLLPRANSGTAQTVMLLSGDGGLLDILSTLLSNPRTPAYKKPTIILLPLGTGNALAHSSGLTADNTLGLRTWMRGTPKEVPYFRATFSPGARVLFDEARSEHPLPLENGVPTAYGAVVCSWAFHAGLVADSDTAAYRQFGAERFQMAAKEALYPSDGSLPHAYSGKVSVLRTADGKENWHPIPRDEHLYILATLVSHLEAGFTISPASKPLDGKLRLVHFGAMTGDEAMAVMGGAYSGGKHVEDARIGYEEIGGLRIEMEEKEARWQRVCVDGRIVRVEEGGWVEVRMGGRGVVDLVAGE